MDAADAIGATSPGGQVSSNIPDEGNSLGAGSAAHWRQADWRHDVMRGHGARRKTTLPPT